ncbi:prolyl oligopeptidase family serine peptidase [Paracidobacterium acidisoli]|nr:alpha/beta hydrolase-fold protein [Paracidobacterium acidisoli]MBT9331822.1 prolyl oligopeptidase family serine peptidase [Paracidobacterium acidisoli]
MVPRLLLIGVLALFFAAPARPFARHPQDTGFLNRSVLINGVQHHYMVYLPENWNPHDRWPMILFLHGSGERGVEGMDQIQIGLPSAIRLHPERWPFIVVMPQVPFSHHHWTDPDMMQLAISTLDAETKEFHGDRDRTYLTGLSLGGYGVWEIAKDYPHRFAAIVPVCGGIFWSYAPSRWHDLHTLPADYVRSIGRTPVWIFHGAGDPIVPPREAVIMFQALKAAGGNVRFWQYSGVRHNVWDKAYAEPQLPRWLLAQRLSAIPRLVPASEQILVPLHPVPARVSLALYDEYSGEYQDQGVTIETIFRTGDRLMARNRVGDMIELLPESAATWFYPTGSPTRLTFERDSEGRVSGIRFRDDRHEEFWEKKR